MNLNITNKLELFHNFSTLCYVFKLRYGDLKFSKKCRSTNESELEKSIKAQIEGLDVNFYMYDKRIFIIDVELSNVALKF